MLKGRFLFCNGCYLFYLRKIYYDIYLRIYDLLYSCVKMYFMRKYFTVLFLLFSFCSLGLSAKKAKTVYVFGASFSFSDSIVYFTEVQKIDSVVFDKEHNFLPDRQHYSSELADYMSLKENKPGRTSALYYSKKLSTVRKKEAKLKRKLLKKNKTVLYLGNKFSFTRP